MTLTDPVWNHAKPFVQAALDVAPRTHTIDDVREMIERGEAQLWSSENSAVVTKIHDEPQALTLFYWLIGGKMSEVMGPLKEASEAWGKSVGCKYAMGIGRKGFERALEPHGYRYGGVVMVKDIT